MPGPLQLAGCARVQCRVYSFRVRGAFGGFGFRFSGRGDLGSGAASESYGRLGLRDLRWQVQGLGFTRPRNMKGLSISLATWQALVESVVDTC